MKERVVGGWRAAVHQVQKLLKVFGQNADDLGKSYREKWCDVRLLFCAFPKVEMFWTG